MVFYNCSSGDIVVNNFAVSFGLFQSVLVLAQSRKLRHIPTLKIK